MVAAMLQAADSTRGVEWALTLLQHASLWEALEQSVRGQIKSATPRKSKHAKVDPKLNVNLMSDRDCGQCFAHADDAYSVLSTEDKDEQKTE